MTTQLSDVQLRFLRTILERIPLERLVELHLFSPLRQGAQETGAAVVAALPESSTPGSAQLEIPGHRHTVFSARYRLTLKGPDRGRWEADVKAEADAPLVTVDAVVRGVQHRAGDGAAEPERWLPEQLRQALEDGPWTAPR